MVLESMKDQLRLYKEYMEPVIKNRLSLFKYLKSGANVDILFYNGMQLHFDKQEKHVLFDISRGMTLLKRIDVPLVMEGDILSIKIFPHTNIKLDIKDLTNVEISNTLLLIYYSIKYGAVINPSSSTQLGKIEQNTITIDTERKIIKTREGIRFRINDIEPWIFAETFILRIHDRFIHDIKGRTVLDIGACFGDTALYFAVNGAEVYSVEPAHENFLAMQRNFELNRQVKAKIHPIKVVIGNDRQSVSFRSTKGMIDGGSSAFTSRTGYTEQLKSYYVLSLMEKFDIKSVDYLKMDCKGGEFFLRKEDRERVNKYLQIEYTAEDDNKTLELAGLIKKSGFELILVRSNPNDEQPTQRHGTIYAVRQNNKANV
jgi:FkbM family methyltransferase